MAAAGADTCASPTGSGRVLALHASGPGPGTVVLGLPVPRAGKWRVTPRFLLDRSAETVALDVTTPDGAVLAHWGAGEGKPRADGSAAGRACVDGATKDFTAESDHELRLVVARPNDAAHLVALDRVVLVPTPR